MPSVSEHEKQYSRNKKFIDVAKEACYADWCMTAIFYAAVHLVEKILAENKKKHSESHVDRGRQIEADFSLFPSTIQVAYKQLYSESMRSRYKCCEISEMDIISAKANLNHIEKQYLN